MNSSMQKTKATSMLHVFGLSVITYISAMFSPIAVAAPGAHGPNGEHLDASTAVSASGLMRLPDGSVNVPMLAQRRLGIRTQLTPETQAAATIELSGRVVVDPNASGRVQAIHGGRIEAGPRGLPVAGQTVRQGEVLAYVAHHAEPYALANQQAQLAELRSSRELAAQRVQRLQSLEGTVPRKEIEAARAELQSLTAREKSIGASLAAREPLLAPVSGVIARADVTKGQVVEAREVLFEVIDPARVLVEATTADSGLPARTGTAHLQGGAWRQVAADRRCAQPARWRAANDLQGGSGSIGQGFAAGGRTARHRRGLVERAGQRLCPACAGRRAQQRQRTGGLDQVRCRALHSPTGAISVFGRRHGGRHAGPGR